MSGHISMRLWWVFALASERKFGFVFFELKFEIGKPISVLILV